MYSKKENQFWFHNAVSLLCILCVLFQPISFPIAAQASNTTAIGSEPERTRSNYATQINVPVVANTYVNTQSGLLFSDIPLLNIPTRGIPINISMRYISGWHNFATHYGYGWQLNYNMFYLRNENGDIVIVWENGRADKFVKSDGSYLSPVDTYDSFREYRPGKYILRTPQGMEYYFDSPVHKRLSKVQDPNGNSLSYDYNADACLISIADNSGRQVHFSYTDGNLAEIIDSNTTPNRSVKLTYDAENNIAAIVDPQGNTTRYSYDADHYLTTVTPASGGSASISYTNGAVSLVDDTAVHKSFSYDTGQRITTVTDIAPDGNRIVRYLYDSLGCVRSVDDALGNIIVYNWDENNNLISVTDPLNRSTSYTYDAMGNLLTATDPLGNTTQYTYENTFSKVQTVTNAVGNTTAYDYDSRGNLIRETDPQNNSSSYAYDEQGNLISRTDANGATTGYEYNEHGELTKATYPDNSTVTYDLDNAGNVTGMKNAHAEVLFSYDVMNRLVGVNYASQEKSVSYTHDATGNRTSMTDPDGGLTTYEYDEANRLIRLTNHLGQVTRYTYDALNRLAEKKYHNGTSAAYTYDKANRLLFLVNEKSSGEVITSYAYQYDAAGNRTQVTEKDGAVTTYNYDETGQLTKVVCPDGSFQEYTYDAVGNRLTLKDDNGTTSYSYDNADRLLNSGTTTYGWDKNGNMISRTDQNGTTNYVYDYENMLTGIKFPDGSSNTFTYYADGRRRSATDKTGKATYYFYNGPNALMETDAAGATLARYTSTGIDNWISMDRGGQSYFYHKDALGSVTGLTDAVGNTAAVYRYDVFGNPVQQASSIVNPYRYTGREYEFDGGMYYYRARYYDSLSGRFLSADPIGFVGGINRYVYVNNSPIIFTDPTGNKISSDQWRAFIWGYIGLWDPTGILGIIPPPKPITDATSGGSPNTRSKPVYNPDFERRNQEHVSTYLQDVADMMNGGGTSSSSGGGIESKPLKNVPPSYFYRKPSHSDSLKKTVTPIKTLFWDKMLDGASTGATTVLAAVKSLFVVSKAYAAEPLVDLRSVLPDHGPSGTNPVLVTPSGPLVVNSNAVEAVATDFVDFETGVNKATVFAIKTVSKAYEHDYPLCNRFHDYTLETASSMPLPGVLEDNADTPWFWYISMTNDKLIEEAYVFAVYVDEEAKTFTVDSQWLSEQYPAPASPEYDYIFNFQIWAASSEEAYKLLRGTLSNLATFGPGWEVKFLNTSEPASPSVLIKSASTGNTVTMTVQSWLDQPRQVTFTGYVRYPDDRENSIAFTDEITINPGFNRVELPFYHILDALITVKADNFTDRIYTGTGSWFAYKDDAPGSSSNVILTLPNCSQAPNLTSQDFVLAGCAEMTGTVDTNGWAGIARTLNPNDLPVDVSQYQALTFFAKGDGKSYRVTIESDAVKQLDSSDFHQYVFTTSSEWRQYVIPLALFTQRGWDVDKLTDLTGTDIVSVAFESVSAPLESINLAVDRLGFVNSTIITGTTVQSDAGIDGVHTVSVSITDDGGIKTVTLYYSIDGGATFIAVPMTSIGNIYSASIPGQSVGTEVLYYIEAEDSDGNVAINPVNFPSAIHRYQISEYPDILVDDFTDTDPTNLLGGNSGTFYADNAADAVLVHYDGGSLRVDYNGLVTDKYAGYYTLLNHLDLSSYNVLSFLIKGSNGGEKVKMGLRDSSYNETKILISKYLPEGITTSWQKVTVPLVAFARLADLSDMENFHIGIEERIGSGIGTVFLDDIKFEHNPFERLVVDNFNDMTEENALGGKLWNWTADSGSATIVTSYDQTDLFETSGACYKILYNGITSTDWALSVTDLSGLDASTYQILSFFIKGEKGDERPNIWLVSNDGAVETRGFADIEDYISITPFWQRVDIPLNVFELQGVDLSNLSLFQVGFEWENMVGTVFLDDISLEFHGSIYTEPKQKDFGSVNIGTSEEELFIISNAGTENHTVGKLVVAGKNADEFSIEDDTCSSQILTSGEYCTVNVSFSPTTEGSIKYATLSIPSTDTVTPEVDALLSGHTKTMTIDIDIKPGSCRNPINIKSNGVFSVAVLGTESLDVSWIDPMSISLNGVKPLRWTVEDISSPVVSIATPENTIDCDSSVPDGFPDLVLKFTTQEFATSLGEVKNGDVRTAPLSGKLNGRFNRIPFQGKDMISILKNGK